MDQCMEAAKQITAAHKERFWAAADAVNKGTPPPAPDYSDSAAKGIQADISTLPARKIIEAAAKAGTKGSVTVDGKIIPYDFSQRSELKDSQGRSILDGHGNPIMTGTGTLQQQQIELQGMRESADAIAKMSLDIQQRYGKDMNLEQLQRIKEADPVGWEVRQKLAQTTLEELSAGRELGAAAGKQVEASVRGAQSARGNIYGAANIGQEALAKFDAGQRLLTQRMSQAQAYALGTPITAQYGAISGAQQGAANFAPMQLQQGIGQNANAAQQSAQFASSNYSTYVQGMANQSNPWMEGLGMVAGMAGSALGGPLGGMLAGGSPSSVSGPGGQHMKFQGNSGTAYSAQGY
jgi:hypothetical protein